MQRLLDNQAFALLPAGVCSSTAVVLVVSGWNVWVKNCLLVGSNFWTYSLDFLSQIVEVIREIPIDREVVKEVMAIKSNLDMLDPHVFTELVCCYMLVVFNSPTSKLHHLLPTKSILTLSSLTWATEHAGGARGASGANRRKDRACQGLLRVFQIILTIEFVCQCHPSNQLRKNKVVIYHAISFSRWISRPCCLMR